MPISVDIDNESVKFVLKYGSKDKLKLIYH